MKRRDWLKGVFAGIVLRTHGVKSIKKVSEIKEVEISEVLRTDKTIRSIARSNFPTYPVTSGTTFDDIIL